MSDYYVTRNCLSNDKNYICVSSGTARDTNFPFMWIAGLIVSSDTARMIRHVYGKDSVKQLPGTARISGLVHFIPAHPGGNFGNSYYFPVLLETLATI